MFPHDRNREQVPDSHSMPTRVLHCGDSAVQIDVEFADEHILTSLLEHNEESLFDYIMDDMFTTHRIEPNLLRIVDQHCTISSFQVGHWPRGYFRLNLGD